MSCAEAVPNPVAVNNTSSSSTKTGLLRGFVLLNMLAHSWPVPERHYPAGSGKTLVGVTVPARLRQARSRPHQLNRFDTRMEHWGVGVLEERSRWGDGIRPP